MLPNILGIFNTPALRDLLGVGEDGFPDRLFDFDSVPQGTSPPYVSTLLVSDDPIVNVSDAPCSDRDTVQIDCYDGPKEEGRERVRVLAHAVRAALDTGGHRNRVVVSMREPDTHLFRITIEADVITQR